MKSLHLRRRRPKILIPKFLPCHRNFEVIWWEIHSWQRGLVADSAKVSLEITSLTGEERRPSLGFKCLSSIYIISHMTAIYDSNILQYKMNKWQSISRWRWWWRWRWWQDISYYCCSQSALLGNEAVHTSLHLPHFPDLLNTILY